MAYLPLIHHRDYTADTPDAHRFPMRKFERLASTLIHDGLVPHGFHVPEPITRADLVLTHTPDYVDQILGGTLDQRSVRRLGLPLSDSVILRARLATGGTLLAARLALSHGLSCNTAGGSHHAHADFGAGFCVFNDVAVAANVILREHPAFQILVIDLDVHHGDGTASIFAHEPRVFTFSMHCEANWPIVKPPSSLDVTLKVGTTDTDYMQGLGSHLPHVLDTVRPDLVFYIAGVDPHEEDRLGKLALTDFGLMARERFVVEQVRTRLIPMVSVLGGGYTHDLDVLAARHALVFHACADWLGRA